MGIEGRPVVGSIAVVVAVGVGGVAAGEGD